MVPGGRDPQLGTVTERTPLLPVVVARRLIFDQRFKVHVALERVGIENVACVDVSVGLTVANAGDAAPRVASATVAMTAVTARRGLTRFRRRLGFVCPGVSTRSVLRKARARATSSTAVGVRSTPYRSAAAGRA